MSSKKKEPKQKETLDLAGILAKRGGLYLSDQEKHEFSRDETPFSITEIKQGKGSFGARWELSIIAGKREAILTVPTHDARDEAYAMLAALVKKSGPQGPVFLSIRDMENDHSWLSLSAVKQKEGK